MAKRIISLILVCVMLGATCLCSVSCTGPISDGELRDILTELLPKDAVLNGYIWGDGFTVETLETDTDVSDSNTPVYRKINNSPYPNIEAMKDEIAKVYTEEMCSIIEQYAFENTGGVMCRFCNDVDDEGKIIGIRMDVTDNHEPYKLTTTAYISTAKVVRSTEYMMDAEIDVTYGKDGSRSGTIEISLLNDEGVWKINSQTWIVSVEQ